MKFADRLVTIREALTTQDLSMKEPGANLRSAETTSDAAPIINKAGGVPSPDKTQAVDADKGLCEQLLNVVTALGLVRTFFADHEGDAETAENLESALATEQKKIVKIAMQVAALQSGAGLEALLAKALPALQRAGGELDYCVFHIKNGSVPSICGDQVKARDLCWETAAAIEAAMKESGNG
jgi:hypothetical protein